MARIAPLEPPYSPDIAETLQRWMPPGAPVEPLALFRVLAHHPDWMGRMRPLGTGILGTTSHIPAHDRELIINRTCAVCDCEYEWGVHVTAFGALVGLEATKLAATRTHSADDPLWTPHEALLLKLVDHLHTSATVPDALWQALQSEWDTQQILELVTIVGWYHLIAFLANVAGITPETWAMRFPPAP